MTRKLQPPKPPLTAEETAAEINSLNASIDVLTTFSKAFDAGDVERSAALAMQAVQSGLDHSVTTSMVHSVCYQAVTTEQVSPRIVELLCSAADAGMTEHAYNAANMLMDANDYARAERYYKLAMALDDNPGLKAAAYVNYCPIVRDGLISGEPDWPASIELYEVPARMGLVVAMFNAGNMCCSMLNKGDTSYAARAVSWFEKALELRDAGQPTLDMETLDELKPIFDQCQEYLADLHIWSKFDGANLQVGLRLAQELVARGNKHAKDVLCTYFSRRLEELIAKPAGGPGGNWRIVLRQLEWRFEGETTTEALIVRLANGKTGTAKVDKLNVLLAEGVSVPLYVAHDACLPMQGGETLRNNLIELLAPRHPAGMFFLPRKAIFKADDTQAYTPIYVVQNQTLTRQALWMGCTPASVLQHAAEQVGFVDIRFGTENCWVSIAVNTLDEGFVVKGNAVVNQRYVQVGGGWCMPFCAESHLVKEFGVILADR